MGMSSIKMYAYHDYHGITIHVNFLFQTVAYKAETDYSEVVSYCYASICNNKGCSAEYGLFAAEAHK